MSTINLTDTPATSFCANLIIYYARYYKSCDAWCITYDEGLLDGSHQFGYRSRHDCERSIQVLYPDSTFRKVDGRRFFCLIK